MTLTQTAVLVKRAIVISITVLVLGTASFISYKIWHAYYLAHLPPVEEKPDLKFGLLPVPNFPESTVSTSNFSYSIDTVTGGLPTVGKDTGFEKFVKVYFIPKTVATLLSSERSQTLAEKFSITASPNILSEAQYKFTDGNKNLLVNLDNGNFTYTKEASVSGTIAFDENRLVSNFTQTLSFLGALKDDLQNGRSKVIYLRTAGTDLVSTSNLSEASAVQISLWPAPIDKKPILTSDYNRSLVTTVVTGESNNLDNYLSLNFTYYPIDTSTFATYPLKATNAALEDLKTGKGVVVVEPDKPQVSITSVSLGYYFQENYSPYLQPIYVFEGPNFVAYVSAITKQYQSEGH